MRFGFRGLKTAILCVMLGATAVAQTPTPEQLKIFQSLPQDQQDSLMQSFIGSKSGDGGGTGSGSKLDGKDSSQDFSGNDRQSSSNTVRERKTADGRTLRRSDEDPEIRPFDYVLIDLTPLELAAKDNSAVAPAGSPTNGPAMNASDNSTSLTGLLGASGGNANAAAGLGALAGAGGSNGNTKNNSASDFGRLAVDTLPKTTEQTHRAEQFRDRIFKGNPYQLNQYGVLDIPGLPSVVLAGLTADEATRRLSADPDLREFTVKVTLLRLNVDSAENAKPFGYDLFEGAPSTFAPVKDIQVPMDYVIDPGDTLMVQLFGKENATYNLSVGRDGRIYFPKLGRST